MIAEPRFALAATLVACLILVAFLAGAWFGSRDTRCVSATLPGGGIAVDCRRGNPELEAI